MLQISEETIHWKTLASSSFFLSAEKTLVKTEEELLTFDHEDLINGLGGALGLFLGWSLLYIFQQCFKMARQMRGWTTKIRDKIFFGKMRTLKDWRNYTKIIDIYRCNSVINVLFLCLFYFRFSRYVVVKDIFTLLTCWRVGMWTCDDSIESKSLSTKI